MGAPKGPNNVTSTFFITVHFLPNDLKFEHGAPNLLLAPGIIKPRYVPGDWNLNFLTNTSAMSDMHAAPHKYDNETIISLKQQPKTHDFIQTCVFRIVVSDTNCQSFQILLYSK